MHELAQVGRCYVRGERVDYDPVAGLVNVARLDNAFEARGRVGQTGVGLGRRGVVVIFGLFVMRVVVP